MTQANPSDRFASLSARIDQLEQRAAMPLPNDFRIASLSANLGGALTTWGDGYIPYGTASNIAPTASDPALLNLASAATLNAQAGVQANLVGHFGKVPILHQACVKLSPVTVIRAWIGLASVDFASALWTADNPVANLLAFRFAPGAGDTSWMCCSKDGTTLTAVDSGVAPGTGIRTFEIAYDGAAAVYRIDGNVVGRVSTNLPSAAALWRQGAGLATLEAVAKNCGVGWLHTRYRALWA